MDRITKFPLLDETGQEIVSSLEEINNSMGDYIASNNPYYAYLEDRKIGTLLSTEITKVRDYGLYKRESLMKIDLPKCINVGTYAFYNCSSLENVNLPECINVGKSAFSYCKKLQNVNIPKCTIIKDGAFQYCNFRKIDLNFVEKIESSAFWKCTALECVKISNTETMCVLADKDAFQGTLIASGNGYIYVPDKLVQQYKSVDSWGKYANQIKPLSDYVESEA